MWVVIKMCVGNSDVCIGNCEGCVDFVDKLNVDVVGDVGYKCGVEVEIVLCVCF